MAVWCWDKENKFIEKMKQGIVLYLRPRKHNYAKERKQVEMNRRLETMHVHTHTKK